MAGRKKPDVPEEEGSPAWMNTYGDMVTLLLTFFVLLFSFSTIDAQKWEQIVSSLSGTPFVAIPELTTGDVKAETDPIDSTKWDIPRSSETPQPTPSAQKTDAGLADRIRRFEELYEMIQAYIRNNNLESLLKAEKNFDTILIRMTDSALFNSAKVDILPDAQLLLQEISLIINRYNDLIETIWVEGHTDSVPISSARYRDNTDLSAMRATSVRRYMLSIMDIEPSKIVPIGYGEYRPVDTNETNAGKANNRRVDFVIQGMLEGIDE